MISAYIRVQVILGVGAGIAFVLGWLFDSLTVALILLFLWAVLYYPLAMAQLAAARVASDVQKELSKTKPFDD
jgi:hypothetical protein